MCVNDIFMRIYLWGLAVAVPLVNQFNFLTCTYPRTLTSSNQKGGIRQSDARLRKQEGRQGRPPYPSLLSCLGGEMYVLGAGWGSHTTALCEGLGRWGSRVAKGNSLRHPLTVPVPLEGWIAHTQKGWCSTPARTPTIFTIQQVKITF